MSELTQSPDPLKEFCKVVLSRHKEKWPPSEEKLAGELASFFSLELVLAAESFALCKKLCVEVSFVRLPEGLYGINGRHGDRREIVLSSEEAFPGGKFHTLLHELREMLEYDFRDLGYPTAPDKELDLHAELFAHTARMHGGKKVLDFFFESASKIETDWKRWLAYVASIAFGFLYVASCGMHSRLEDAMIRHKQNTLR